MTSEQWVAIITVLAGGILSGGVGVEVVRRFRASPERKLDEASAIRHDMAALMEAQQISARTDREELRAELKKERERIDLLDAEIEVWRKRCYSLEEELAKTKAELARLRRQVQEEPA